MAESPSGYFPDVQAAWTPELFDQHSTEIMRARSGRPQRRAAYSPDGYRLWQGSTSSLDRVARKRLRDFLQARRGQYGAFYFFVPFPALYEDFQLSSITAATRLVLPFKASSITDVRISGISQTFTARALAPRAGTYAALRFDGAAGTVDCGSSSVFKTTGDFTIAAWVFITGVQGAANNWQIAGNGILNTSGYSYLVGATSGGLQFLRTNQSGSLALAQSTNKLPLGTWAHAAVVRSGTSVTFYRNAIADGTTTGITAPVAATANFSISANAGGVGDWFDGMIADVRFYSTALSASEITNIYNGVATPSPNLKGWWWLADGTGASALDRSGYLNHGTLSVSGSSWTGGEDEVSFASAQTGTPTVWLYGRERITAHNATDRNRQSFRPNAGDVRAIYDLAIEEVY